MESNLDTRLPKLGCSVVVVVYGFIAFVLASQLLQLADDLSTFIVLFVKKISFFDFSFSFIACCEGQPTREASNLQSQVCMEVGGM